MNLGIYSYAESNVGIGDFDLVMPSAHIESIKGPRPNNRPVRYEADTRLTWSSGGVATIAFGFTAPSPGAIIDWGDGQQTITIAATNTSVAHVYCNAAKYKITVSGNITALGFNGIQNLGGRARVTKLLDWGSCAYSLTTFNSNTLNNCTNATQIPKWLPINPTGFTSTFVSASKFNQPIGHWDVSRVTSQLGMFSGASSFNQSLNGWNVSKLTDFSSMFSNATAYKQSMSNWNLAACTSLLSFLSNVDISTPSYDDTLIGWNNNKLQTANGVADWSKTLQPNFGTSKYTAGGAAATARAALVTYGWTITDGGTA